jgi:Fe2+ transport system protein B
MKERLDEIDSTLVKTTEALTLLQEEIDSLKLQLSQHRSGLTEKFEHNRASIQTVYESVIRYGRVVNSLEQRVSRIRNDANTGVILVLVVFALLFVFTLVFLR